MGTNIKIKIDPAQQILLKRKLGNNGQAQQFFTHEVRRLSDPYIPKLSGIMKDSAIEQPKSITYPQPYARKQYYENKGNGLRGSKWDQRMWADRGPEIVRAVANFTGGKAK